MSYRRNDEPLHIGEFYPECKVYSDGSHYIAIPHTQKPYKPRPKHTEEVVTVQTEIVSEQENSAPSEIDDALIDVDEQQAVKEKTIEDCPSDMLQRMQTAKQMTKKELFNELYEKCLGLPKRERREKLMEKLRPYFKDEEHTALFVDTNLARKRRNLICRRIRLTRKANLQEFNYFVTFTYDGKIHTEESFKKKLRTCLRHLTERKGWKYIGVWERSPEKKRLHFHGIFNIPEGTMPGELFEKRDYNTTSHCMKITVQNTYFNERFGRSDFEKIEGNGRLGEAVAYIMKYIEKSGEKIVYSRGLPQYFISDIREEDIVTTVGMEDSKLLLFDNFTCWDEGCKIGEVSADTIQKLRKSN